MKFNIPISGLFVATIVILGIFYYYFDPHTKSPIIEIQKPSLPKRDDYEIPKIAWTFWDTIEPPELIKQIYEYNRKVLKSWKIIFLNNSNIGFYLNMREAPKHFNLLSPPHKADWIRLALLRQYGGCWVDASLIFNSEEFLNNLYDESIKKQSEFTGFYLEKYTFPNDVNSYLENWFIMAPKKSEVIQLWYDEFTRAITIGFRLYGKEVDKESCIVPQLRNNLYHTQYKCIQMVLHKRLNRKANIIMKSASDTAYKLHTDCDWDSHCVMRELKENSEEMKRMPCIKLIAGDRKTGINISNYFTGKTA